jgi:hypothetical protein
MWHVWETSKVRAGFWLGDLKKKTLGRPRCRGDYDTKTDLQEAVWRSFECGEEPVSSIKCTEFLD